MTLTSHKVRGEDDYYRVRDFLRECYLLNGRHEYCWQPYRLDYARWHGLLNISNMPQALLLANFNDNVGLIPRQL